MQSSLIRLIGVVFLNSDGQINEIAYSRVNGKMPINLLGNWLIVNICNDDDGDSVGANIPTS